MHHSSLHNLTVVAAAIAGTEKPNRQRTLDGHVVGVVEELPALQRIKTGSTALGLVVTARLQQRPGLCSKVVQAVPVRFLRNQGLEENHQPWSASGERALPSGEQLVPEEDPY